MGNRAALIHGEKACANAESNCDKHNPHPALIHAEAEHKGEHQRRQERPAPPPPPRRKPPQQPPQDSFLGIGNFLHQLLPKDFCMEDLMVVLLLLLMSGNGEEDQNFALLTLGLYLFL